MIDQRLKLMTAAEARASECASHNPVFRADLVAQYGESKTDLVFSLEKIIRRRSMTSVYMTAWQRWLQQRQAACSDSFDFSSLYLSHDWFFDNDQRPAFGYQTWLPRACERLEKAGYQEMYGAIIGRVVYFTSSAQHFYRDLKASKTDASPDERFCINALRAGTKRDDDKPQDPDGALFQGAGETGHDLLCLFARVAEAHALRTGRSMTGAEFDVFASKAKQHALFSAYKAREKQHPIMVYMNEAKKPFSLRYTRGKKPVLRDIAIKAITPRMVKSLVKDWPEQRELDLSLVNNTAQRSLKTGCPVIHASPDGNPNNSAIAFVVDTYLADMKLALLEPETDHIARIRKRPAAVHTAAAPDRLES